MLVNITPVTLAQAIKIDARILMGHNLELNNVPVQIKFRNDRSLLWFRLDAPNSKTVATPLDAMYTESYIKPTAIRATWAQWTIMTEVAPDLTMLELGKWYNVATEFAIELVRNDKVGAVIHCEGGEFDPNYQENEALIQIINMQQTNSMHYVMINRGERYMYISHKDLWAIEEAGRGKPQPETIEIITVTEM